MSFKFNWDSFTSDDDFYDRVRTLLSDALNRGKMPNILADRIRVRELYLGDESPQLEILEVGDLADDRFRGIFKLTYAGNASITLTTKIRANPLQVYAMSSPGFCMPRFQNSAAASLSIPLNLTLSDIKLSGIIILVFSKAKGLTLVFRNDPLQSIRVTSTFDTLPGIARFLQTQIETQIRLLFREDLPAILHKLSHKWTPQSNIGLEKSRLHQKMAEHQREKQAVAVAAAAAAAAGTAGGVDTNTTVVDNEDFDVDAAAEQQQENEDGTQEEYVQFGDINPDMPILSPANMVKLNALCASQLTLSLFTPSIKETVYRANLETHGEGSSGASGTNGNALSGLQHVDGTVDLDEIMRIQSRNYFRTSHGKPRRRVIKVGGAKTNNAQQQPSATTSSDDTTTPASAPAPVPVSVSVSIPVKIAPALSTSTLVPVPVASQTKTTTAATVAASAATVVSAAATAAATTTTITTPLRKNTRTTSRTLKKPDAGLQAIPQSPTDGSGTVGILGSRMPSLETPVKPSKTGISGLSTSMSMTKPTDPEKAQLYARVQHVMRSQPPMLRVVVNDDEARSEKVLAADVKAQQQQQQQQQQVLPRRRPRSGMKNIHHHGLGQSATKAGEAMEDEGREYGSPPPAYVA
ncbi:uncharacterized protein SAPINGB_P000556 [Magnusiomyces paraingens]|uniref:Mitochondrial distribution and morphology protein 34 n=1 Tax=Magnusiomyces paraingens TaxID=2606893 RepID=A0A5E8B039_9ASCO|nr:uncharacterized protein SAPINGB_P000556 [Saprochaete ingens]VVT44854.1 unnamed protein product [Saprochaete ingens]